MGRLELNNHKQKYTALKAITITPKDPVQSENSVPHSQRWVASYILGGAFNGLVINGNEATSKDDARDLAADAVVAYFKANGYP